MKLLPKDWLIPTSRIDHGDWAYRPPQCYAVRERFRLIASLLPAHVTSILEVGFGSGIFMPELAARCRALCGVDVHDRVYEVQARLAEYGVRAHLVREDAAHTSFADSSFDVIVAVSALEFIQDIHGAAREFARLLKPNGRLLAVMPQTSSLLDLALRVMTGEHAQRDYGNRREAVVPALMRHFEQIRKRRFLLVYTAYELKPRKPQHSIRKGTSGEVEVAGSSCGARVEPFQTPVLNRLGHV